jgi:DNA-binding MarR family transcriptional regulator
VLRSLPATSRRPLVAVWSYAGTAENQHGYITTRAFREMMPGQLSVNDRVLLHLYRFATDTPPEEYPAESTQVGIAVGVGISRTHVPRAVKTLMREGFVEEFRGRVVERDRRMSVYAVTSEGFRRAETIWKEARESIIAVVREGRRTEMKGSALEDVVGKRRAIGLLSQMKDGAVELSDRKRPPVRLLECAPAPDDFFGRTGEMEALERFLESGARVMVVLSGKGLGATSLVREFVEACDTLDVLWQTVGGRADADELGSAVISFANETGHEASDLESALALPGKLFVFDDYHSVGEGVVEFFSDVVASLGGSKIIVIAREDIPAYSWFYQKRHVDSGIVQELRMRGIDEASAKKLLGNPDIEPDAFRRVYLMSRGQPKLLRLLRDGDIDGLKRASVFTTEEIKYLLFLKDKTA